MIVGKIFAKNVSISSRKVKSLAVCHYILDLLGSLSRDLNPCRNQSHLLEESYSSLAISRFQYKVKVNVSISFYRGFITAVHFGLNPCEKKHAKKERPKIRSNSVESLIIIRGVLIRIGMYNAICRSISGRDLLCSV